eukprot:TRINITY_DN34546_c0_g1_i1.p1 TRINITY_DN34546_c0_g1~~TRINITY_DN34546_c0_g1_i1.p1  ORF type:complete len:333 (-),score=35.99 TRINITY_DN34546_c0_g1_i1:77-1036(-)
MFDSQLLLGLAIGVILGATFAILYMKRMAKAQYASLPMYAPSSELRDLSTAAIAQSYGKTSPACGNSAQGGGTAGSTIDIDEDSFVDAESGSDEESGHRTARYGRGLLLPTVACLERALILNGDGDAVEVWRIPLFEALESYATVLNALGGNMGSYLSANISKLHSSKAHSSELSYRPWLLSELAVHSATGFQSYVDDSAWMANLWIAWTLQFFVCFFELVCSGRSTSECVETAYNNTLYNHHNFFQRQTFRLAMKRMPERTEIISKLRGDDASIPDHEVLQMLNTFVAFGSPLVRFCLQMNEEVSKAMQDALVASRRR